MAETPGICTQTTICEVARSGRTMTVPLGSPFLCPECGRGLVPPLQITEPVSVQRMPAAVPLALVGAGLLVLGGAVFLGRELGEAAVAPAPQVVASVPAKPGPMPVLPALPPVRTAALAAAATPGPAPDPTPAQAAPASDLKAAPVAMPAKPADTGPVVSPAPGSATALATPAMLPPDAPAPPTAIASVAPTPAAPAVPAVALIKPAAPEPQAAVKLAALPPPAPPPAATPSVAAPVPAPAPVLPDQPFSAVAVSGGTPAYPVELAADGRPGRVNVSCQIAADGSPSGCHAVASKGGPAFAAATLAWLAHAHVRYHPIILHGHAVAAARSWTLAVEEPPALLAEARRKQQEAAKAEAAKVQVVAATPEPAQTPRAAVSLPVQPIIARQFVAASPAAVSDRPFSTRVVAGGAPVFPASYDDSRPGAVTVSCMIGEGGAPSGCRVLKAVGGSAFGRSVQAWLASGHVRFRPMTSGGQPVAREASWTIVFNSVPVPQ